MQPIPILVYHSVADLTNPLYDRWCVSPRRFRQQMSVLADHGYDVLTTGDLAAHLRAGLRPPDRCAVITFDDGLQDFLTGAFPILTEFGFPATLYVVAGLVGESSRWLAPLGEGSRPMLTSAELRHLSAAGIEIGAHSMTHPELDVLDPGAARNEIEGSRRVLGNMIGTQIASFAYPHGYNSPKTRQIVQAAGFSSAVRVRHALSDVSECIFGLSRLVVTDDLDPDRFASILQGTGLPVAPPQDRLVANLWRLARRLRRWPGQRGTSAARHHDDQILAE